MGVRVKAPTWKGCAPRNAPCGSLKECSEYHQCHFNAIYWRLLVYSIYSLFIIVLQWDNRHNMIEYLMIHAQRWIYWLSEYQISSSGIYHESMNPLANSSACSSGTVCETRCSCVVSWVKLSELRHQWRRSQRSFSEMVIWENQPNLVGGLEHCCYFPLHIWDVILPIDEFIFFKMVGWNHQPDKQSVYIFQ